MKKIGLLCLLSPLICFSMNTEMKPIHERTEDPIAYEDLIQEPLILSESEPVHSETAVSSQANGESLEIQPVQRNSSKQNGSSTPSYKGGAQEALKHSNRPRVTHREAKETNPSNVVEEKPAENVLRERSAIVDDFAAEDHVAPPIIQNQAQSQVLPPESSVESRAQKLDPLRNPRVRLRPSRQAARQQVEKQEQIAAPQREALFAQEPPKTVTGQPNRKQQPKAREQNQVPKEKQSAPSSTQTEEKKKQQAPKNPQQQKAPKPRQSVQTEENKEAKQPRMQPQTKPRQQRSSPALRQAPRQSVQREAKEKQMSPRSQREAAPKQQRSTSGTTQNSSRNSVYSQEGQNQQRTSVQPSKQLHRESASKDEGESKALSYHYRPNRVVLISSEEKSLTEEKAPKKQQADKSYHLGRRTAG